jgi:kynurenine formamidase
VNCWMGEKPTSMSMIEFEQLFEKVSNWGKWGPEDRLGTLNYITSSHIRAAAGLVQSGRTVSMAIPVNTVAGPDNAHPAVHYMAQTHDTASSQGEPSFALDYIGCEFHGDCHTHIDALCHIGYKGRLYNDRPVSSVVSSGARIMDITEYAHGIVGRGVLLDVPRLRGVKWLEPGEAVTVEELLAAEEAERVRLGEGDIFLFRTGHHRRRLDLGSWNCGSDGQGRAGLDPSAMLLLHERRVAAFLPDGDGETMPSRVEGVAAPIHALQIGAMGMACADSLQFEELKKVCEEEGRWEFMVVVAPLRFPRCTGSLVNPIALL